MKQYRKSFAWAGLAGLLMALVATWAPTAPAHAAPSASGSDTLTLSMANGTNFTYGGTTTPTITAVLVLAQPFTTNPMWQVIVHLNTGQQLTNIDPPGASSDKLTYTFTIPSTTSITPIIPGNYTATGTFDNYDTGITTTSSNSVNFTMAKEPMSLSCDISGGFKPGQSAQVLLTALNTGSSTPVDWTQGTATVWFVGPTTVTTSNLQPDSAGNVTVTTPPQVGYYALNCSFTGTTYYAPSQMITTNNNVLISESQSLGGVKLYTNPTTIVAGTPIQMYIVFNAGPGLPTPTGQITVYIGQGSYSYYTQPIKIGSNGTAFVTLGAIPNLYSANVITITYWGDPYYKGESVNFPMTNAAIPSGSGGGTTPGQASAAATPHAKATASATASATSIGGASSADGGATTTPNASPSALSSFGLFSGGGLIALLLAIALLVAGSGVATFVLLSRRGAARGSVGSVGSAPLDPPAPYSGSSFNADTLPQRRMTPQQPPQQWPPEQWPPRQ